MHRKSIFPNMLAVLLCCFVAMGGDVPRLAVFVDGDAEESRMLADMMQAELSKREGFEVVERSEIDRVLREQELGAAGFADAAARVRLGQILKAKGLVFVGQSGEKHRVRIVETEDGFLAGYLGFPRDASLARVCATFSEGIGELMPKLLTNPELQTCVTILPFNTALIGPNESFAGREQFDAGMLDRLTEALCAEPDVLVLERRRAGDLHDEAKLAGVDPHLKSGALLIDGELATPVMQAVDTARQPVVLTVRVRDLSGRKIDPVVAEGFYTARDALQEGAVGRTVDVVRRNLRTGSADTLQAERERLIFLAREKNAVWAGEAAHALDPTDAKARDLLIERLFKTGSLYKYVQAEQLCREHGVRLDSKYFTQNIFMKGDVANNLSREDTHVNPELKMILQPLRNVYASVMEEAFTVNADWERRALMLCDAMELIPAIAGTNRERWALRWKMFERVMSDPSIDERTRDSFIAYVSLKHLWPLKFFITLSQSDDPVQRFHGHYRLMRKSHKNPLLQRQYAELAIEDVDAVLRRNGALGTPYHFARTPRREGLEFGNMNNWMVIPLAEIQKALPEYSPMLQRKVFDRVKQLVQEKDLDTLEYFEPHKIFTTIPDAERLTFYESVLQIIPEQKPSWKVSEMQRRVTQAMHDLRKSTQPKESTLVRQVLLTRTDAEKKWPEKKNEWRYDSPYGGQSSHLLPNRLLLEGDTLWIGCAGDTRKSHEIRNTTTLSIAHYALMAMDTESQQIVSAHFGGTTGDNVQDTITSRGGNRWQSYPLLPLIRWNDSIVMTHRDIGIGLFSITGRTVTTAASWATVHFDKEEYISLQTMTDETLFFVKKRWLHHGGDILMTWNPKASQVSIILNAEQDLTHIGLPELRFDIVSLWFDKESDRVTLVFLPFKNQGNSSYKSTDAVASNYDPTANQWTRLSEIPQQTPAPEARLRAAARKALEEDRDEHIVDIAIIDEHTFYAIVGFSTDWRLEKVTVNHDK